MKKPHLILPLLPLLAACATTPPEKKPELPKLETKLQKSSYALGVEFMKNLTKDEITLDKDLFNLGIDDVLAGNAMRLDDKQFRKALDWVIIQRVQYHNKISDQNLAEGKMFLAQNKLKPGVIELPSGVQYRVLKSGNGNKKPTLSHNVALRYRIMRTNGEEVSSSDKKSTLPEFSVEALIKGWQEAVMMMVVGDKWEIFAPGPLAYGEKGVQKRKIGPNEAMIFETELVDIKKPEK